MVVGAVALIATGVGAAAGAGWIGAAAGSSAAAAGAVTSATIAATATTVASFASAAAIGLSLGAAATYNRPPLTGSQTTFNSDPSAGIPYLMGRTFNAGNIVYWDTNDTTDKGDNDRQTFVAVISGAGPIEEIENFYCDQVVVPFGGTGAALGFYSGWMWQKTQLGQTPEPAALSIPADPIVPPGWTSAHKLSGYAAAMWRMRFDTKGKKFTNGTPKPGWLAKGVKVYDPRLDSTYPGGSGSCRALDESTYVWSENPYLHGLTWCLGRWQNGIRILGIGALLACIDVPAFVEGANVADLNNWKIGGVAYSTDNKWETLVSMLQAGAGEPMPLGAKISCFVNAPKVSLDTITIGDLSGTVSNQTTQARRDRLNGIIPRYRSEDHFWEVVSAAPVRVPEYVEFDGGERTKEADYQFVQNVDQAATLARYGIENSREFGPITMPLRPRWIGYKPGDAVTVTIPEVGLNGQKVLLTNRDIDAATGCPVFTARSETDAKHPYALGQTTDAPPTPTVTGPPLVPVPDDGTWTIEATSITDGENTLPALAIEGAIDSTSADAVVFEYRLWFDGQDDDDGWIAAGIEPPETTAKIIGGVLPATVYEAAVSYRRQGVVGARSILGPVTTDALVLQAITAIADDGILDRGEKPAVVKEYQALITEQSGIDARATAQGITTEKTGYDNAVTALTSYLTGLSPAYNDYDQDTAITRATFISKFNDVYLARQALLNQIDKLGYDGGQQALNQIATIVADNVLDKSEKPEVVRQFSAIIVEQGGIDIQAAALGITTEKTTYDAAILALTTYLTGLSPAYNNYTADTNVTRTTFITKFNDVYTARQAVINKMAGVNAAAAAAAQADATASLSQITTIVTDSILDKSEKPEIVRQYNAITAEQSGIDAQATAYGIITEKSTYDSAVSALTTYLGGLSPAYNSYTTDTTIVRATFITKFNDVYTSRQALLNKIAELASNKRNVTGGGNRVPFSRFETGWATYWGNLFNPSGVVTGLAAGTSLNRRYLQASITASAGGQTPSLGSLAPGFFPVTAGERLAIQTAMETTGVMSGTHSLVIHYYNSAGAQVSAPTVASTSGLKSWGTILGGFDTAPAGAVKGQLEIYFGSASAGAGTATVIEPMVTQASQDQTLLPAFSPGPNANDGATIGAPTGTPVGSITASDVDSTINSGGGVANDKVSTPAIINNAVSQTTMQTMGGTLTGSGAYAFQDAISYSLVMPYAGDAIFVGDLGQGYSSGVLPQAWEVRVTVDGTAIRTKGGAGWGTDSASIGCAKTALTAGMHTVKLQWRGDNANLSLLTATLSITAPMK